MWYYLGSSVTKVGFVIGDRWFRFRVHSRFYFVDRVSLFCSVFRIHVNWGVLVSVCCKHRGVHIPGILAIETILNVLS